MFKHVAVICASLLAGRGRTMSGANMNSNLRFHEASAGERHSDWYGFIVQLKWWHRLHDEVLVHMLVRRIESARVKPSMCDLILENHG